MDNNVSAWFVLSCFVLDFDHVAYFLSHLLLWKHAGIIKSIK